MEMWPSRLTVYLLSYDLTAILYQGFGLALAMALCERSPTLLRSLLTLLPQSLRPVCPTAADSSNIFASQPQTQAEHFELMNKMWNSTPPSNNPIARYKLNVVNIE